MNQGEHPGGTWNLGEHSGEEGGLARNMLSEMAYDALKDRIINLQLPPKAKLNLDRLAAEFRISQTPIREALSRLMAENLVCMKPFKGFSVESLLSLEEVHHLSEVRTVLETYAAAQAVERMNEEDLTVMRHQVQTMDELMEAGQVNIREFNGADAAFHLRFVLAAGNPILTQTYASLNVHVRVARLFQGRRPEMARQANSEHQQILTAFVQRDTQSVIERVADHIHSVQNRLRAALSSDDIEEEST